AQSNVEQQNFEIRKNVLKYDDVMNTQRKVIYSERTKLLEGESFEEEAREMLDDVILASVDSYASEEILPEEWDLGGLMTALSEIYPARLKEDDLKDKDGEELKEIVLRDVHEAYTAKEAELGPETMRRAERLVMLNVLDAAWRDHLYEMDYLREGIGLRAMGQRDPLVEYQREGYEYFQNLMGRIRDEFSRYIFHVSTVDEERRTRRQSPLRYAAPQTTSDETAPQRAPRPAMPAQPTTAGGAEPPPPGLPPQAMPPGAMPQGAGEEVVYETIKREGDKVGRNDPCPCGSGKKYKKCHGLGV
ncbi:MAG: SEC-C metal-binding domain-containing protein, partial [Actinomycetota bacterium]